MTHKTPVTVNGVRYPSLTEAAEAHGVSKRAMLNMGERGEVELRRHEISLPEIKFKEVTE